MGVANHPRSRHPPAALLLAGGHTGGDRSGCRRRSQSCGAEPPAAAAAHRAFSGVNRTARQGAGAGERAKGMVQMARLEQVNIEGLRRLAEAGWGI